MGRIRRILTALTIAAVAAAATGTGRASAAETLRWKFREGQRLNYDIAQTMNMQMTVMGMDVESKISQTMDMTWVVKEVADDGTATIGQTIDRIQFKMDGGALVGKVDYDSAKKEAAEGPLAGAMSKTYDALVGGEFTVKMTPLGELRVVELPKKFTDMLKEDPTLKKMPGALTGDTFKQMMSQSGIIFPKQPVEQGDDWTHKVAMNTPFGDVSVNSRMKYLETEKKGGRALEKISVDPEMTVTAKPDSPFKIEMKSSDGSGTVLFDNDAGQIVESSLKQKMVMAIEAGGNTIEQTIDQTVEMKLDETPAEPTGADE